MKINKHKIKDKIEIEMPKIEKEITIIQITDGEIRYCDNNPTTQITTKLGRDYKQAERDINKLSKLLKRMYARGWKIVEEVNNEKVD